MTRNPHPSPPAGLVALCLSLLLAPPTVAWAQAPEKPEGAAGRFAPLLDRFAARLNGGPGYKVVAVEDWETTGAAEAQKGTTRYTLEVAHPGRFAIRSWPSGGGAPTIEVGCDGKTLTTAVRGEAPLHSVSRPVDPAEGVRRNPLLAAGFAGSFFGPLLRPDLADFVADSVSNVVDLGVEPVGEADAPARHFRGVWSDGRSVEFWCAEGEKPELLQVRLTRYVPPAEPGGPVFSLSQTTRYDWAFGAPPADAFEVSPAADSKEVDDLYAAVTGAGETLTPGAKAPALDLPLLGGGRLDLARHAGKDPVVLNFWAGWYPIGLESLPTVAGFADEYGPKGVKFYHINLAEPQAVVERSVAALGLPMTVALDPEGVSMERYAVRALPFTVLIGRDGAVRAVNPGDLRGFKGRFREQLDGLVSEK